MPFRPQLTGDAVLLEIGRGSIKLAASEAAGEAVRFSGITKLRAPDPQPDAPRLEEAELIETIGEEVRARGWVGRPGVCLLSGARTSTQSFLLPAMPAAEMRQAIELKLSEALHFDISEACFDHRVLEERATEHGTQLLVSVVAAHREAVRRAVRVLRAAGLIPVAIGAASQSLANLTYYASLASEGEATIHADLGSRSTILNLFEGRMLRFSREIDVAGEAFTQALTRPILTESGPLTLTYAQAEEVKRAAGYPLDEQELELPYGLHVDEISPLLEPVAQRLTVELKRSIDYLRGILGRSSVDRIVLSGAGAAMRNLDVALEEALGVQVIRVDPVARAVAHWRLAIRDEDAPDPAGFSGLLGYSLGKRRPINLLPSEEHTRALLRSTARIQKAVAPAAGALAVSLALLAVPIQRSYGNACAWLQDANDQMQRRLDEQTVEASSRQADADLAERLLRERGAPPPWTSLLQELTHVLPPSVTLESLEFVRGADGIEFELTAALAPQVGGNESVLSTTTQALEESPFFTALKVVRARAPRPGFPGELVAGLKLVLETPRGPGAKR